MYKNANANITARYININKRRSLLSRVSRGGQAIRLWVRMYCLLDALLYFMPYLLSSGEAIQRSTAMGRCEVLMDGS
jgi:hypothetical protein